MSDKKGSYSKATTANPKDILGLKKVSLTKFPMVALIHGAHAMMNGADKYGPYNWREKDVIASIYVDAALRHIAAWFEREENAEDSGTHHLGHALACIAILLDAQANGNLVDDRPNTKHDIGVIKDLLKRLEKKEELPPPIGDYKPFPWEPVNERVEDGFPHDFVVTRKPECGR